jgi:hypothetical protein
MSAIELIEQLKALPAHEQADFARLFRHLQEQSPGAAPGGVQKAASRRWPDFTLRLQRIYGRRVVADSETVISYGRGER